MLQNGELLRSAVGKPRQVVIVDIASNQELSQTLEPVGSEDRNEVGWNVAQREVFQVIEVTPPQKRNDVTADRPVNLEVSNNAPASVVS